MRYKSWRGEKKLEINDATILILPCDSPDDVDTDQMLQLFRDDA